MKNELVYLRHIIDAVEKIERYLADTSYKSFSENDMLIDAVVRELEIIGEAAGNISTSFHKKYPEVPWSKMIGMRNRLIHEYFGVNKKVVWETCITDLKELKKLILPIL